MKVFHQEALNKHNWKDAIAGDKGQPLQCWWAEAEAAYKAAGFPAGTIVVRNRVVVDGYDSDTNDGLRSGSFSGTRMVLEVGTI